MSEQKPREFWITESRCNGKQKAYKTQLECWDQIQHNDNEIHVIEKSAYEALQLQLEDHQQAAAAAAEASEADRRGKIIEGLTRERDEYRAALEIIGEIIPTSIATTEMEIAMQDCARALLAKYPRKREGEK